MSRGSDVFAIPGRITDALLPWARTRFDTAKGVAKPVFCVDDILEEYGIKRYG